MTQPRLPLTIDTSSASLDETSRRVKWDEATIAEHDKERGTRMKIDEPKTPYHAPALELAGPEDDIPILNLSGDSTLNHGPVPSLKSMRVSQSADVSAQRHFSDDEDNVHDAHFFSGTLRAELVAARLEEQNRKAQFEANRKAHYKTIPLNQLKALTTEEEDDEDE